MDKITRQLDIIENNLNSHQNNTLILRLVLSLIVFYSHFFAISGLPEPRIPFGIHTLGWYAVNIFFLISGILISRSYQLREFSSYSQSRVLRVVPAYIVSIIISIFLALFFIDVGESQIIESFSVFFSNLFPILMFNGSITSSWAHTAMPGILNSSLWTISFEFLCYFFMIPLFFDKNIKPIKKIIISFVFLYLISKSNVLLGSGIRYDLLRVFGYFLIGIGIYTLISKKKININILLGFAFIFYCEPYIKEFFVSVSLILLSIFFGLYFKKIPMLKNDYSYSIYLFAWPISQTIIYIFNKNVYIELFIALILLAVTSLFSWYFIESPSLRMKNSKTFIAYFSKK
jgi:peptidoglycan/LPS O-acetylase OafA/YrhL